MKRQSLRRLFTSGVIATGLLVSSTAALANNMFLKIDGIEGESLDSKHPGAIDVLSWSWGQSTGTGQDARGRQPATCIQDLNFTKSIDSSSPELIMNAVLGEVAQNAVLTVRKAGGEQQEFLKLIMKNVTVVSFQTGASGDGRLPTEQVTLHFESIRGEYRKQDLKGNLGDVIPWEFTGGNAACRQ